MPNPPAPRKNDIPINLAITMEIMGISWADVMHRAALLQVTPAVAGRRMVEAAISREERPK